MDYSPRLITLGVLTRDYILSETGTSHEDIPGGEAVYSAAGMVFAGEKPGLCARISELYPQDWLDQFELKGIDTSGVLIKPEIDDGIQFFVNLNSSTTSNENPIAHYANLGKPIPKALLGYTNPSQQTDSQTKASDRFIRSSEIPASYLDAIGAHLCEMDYLSYMNILHGLKQSNMRTISVNPGLGMMNSLFFNLFPDLIRDVTIFHTNETRIRQLFYGKVEDLWVMAETISLWGPEFVVIRRGNQGQFVYDRTTRKRWMIPAYPNQPRDAIGAGDSLCGAFLADYLKNYDPLRACLIGSIAASFAIEGVGPLYLIDALPGLVDMRYNRLSELVQEM